MLVQRVSLNCRDTVLTIVLIQSLNLVPKFTCFSPEQAGIVLKVTVPDGRILTGHFSCLDKQGNLVLSRTTQVSSLGTERFLGVVVVPSRQRVRCELE